MTIFAGIIRIALPKKKINKTAGNTKICEGWMLMSRDGYEIISKNVKNYHFRNEVFSCFPLEHNIPNVVVCNFYNFVCWNAAVNREIVREKYQKYTYSNRHHLHGSRTSVGLGTSFSKPLRWHVCSQRSINKIK